MNIYVVWGKIPLNYRKMRKSALCDTSWMTFYVILSELIKM